MARSFKVSLLALAITVAAGAQSTQRRWAGAAEYDLATQSSAEQDPDQQISLLKEWETRYPKTEFERERRISFALAFQRAGKLNESFTRGTELLNIYPDDVAALLLVVTLGPTLPSPSDGQVAVVTASAIKLLSLKLVSLPLAATATSAEQTDSSASLADPEMQRVLAFIRQLRKATSAFRPDPDVLKRQVAEAALEWGKKVKR